MNPVSNDPPQSESSPSTTTLDCVLTRSAALHARIMQRSVQNLLPYDRRMLEAPKPFAVVRERNGTVFEGLNFTSSDYLGLSAHPLVRQAAASAIHRLGTSSAGSAALTGLTDEADALAGSLGDLLHLPHVALFPSGWAAGHGAMRALADPRDAIVMDASISSGVRCGAACSTRRIHTFRHLDLDHARRCLRRLRSMDRDQSIFLITCGLFPSDGACADLSSLHQLCAEFGACLVVDASHDLACTGSEGAGEIEIQSLLGMVPVIIGSLSKTLAGSGGFVAVRSAELCDYIRARSPAYLFSSTISPSQVAAATQALAIVRSPEGAARRAALRRSVVILRAALARCGLEPGGGLGPIVSIPIGSETAARHAVRRCAEQGVLLNLLEYPVIPKGRSRLRLQIMTGHEAALMPEVAEKIALAVREARVAASEIDAPHTFERV